MTDPPNTDRKLTSLRELPQSIEPPHDLWPGIAAQLGEIPAAADDTTRARRRAVRLRWLAAAAMVACVATGVWIGRQHIPGRNARPYRRARSQRPWQGDVKMRIGLGLAGALLMQLGATTASAASHQIFDRQVPAQPRGVVEISNVTGNIEVSGWDRTEVSVHAELVGGAEGVDVSSEGGHTSIKVRTPAFSGHGGARLQVKIPKGSELDVSAVNADISTSGVLGVQRLSAVSGKISAEIAGADTELKTVSGSVQVKGHGQPARLRASTVSGDVHLEHGGGISRRAR